MAYLRSVQLTSRTRLLLAVLFLLAAAGFGYAMWARTQVRELWGYLPLGLYLTAWAGGVLLLSRKRWGEGLVRRHLALSTLSGFLFGLGFPGYLPAPLLLLFAWIPLFIVQRELRELASSRWAVFGYGLNAFLLYNVLATFWVTNTAFAAGLFAVGVNSLLMTIPWLLFDWASRQSPNVSYLALAAYWISFEHLHYNWGLNWPWLTLGNGFAQFPGLIQWYEWTGVLGGSAWVFLVNWLTFRWLLRPFPRPVPLAPLLAILLPVGLSFLRYFTYSESELPEITVAAVQPNYEPHYAKFSATEREVRQRFSQLTLAATEAGPVDYLLLPETSVSRVVEDSPLDNPTLRTIAETAARLPIGYLVTGFDGYHLFADASEYTDAVRFFPNNQGGQIALEALNGALQVDLATDEVQTYRKGVFVPGAESFPFRSTLFFLEPLVNSLGGTVAGRGTQERRLPLTSETAAVAPVICYESVFGEYFTDYIREGAQAVFVMTNDGWWDNTAGHRQHLWFSSLRAIETRRAVVRSANTGVSAFINQRGEIVSRLGYGEEGVLRGKLRLNDAITGYVRFGDIVARVALLLAVMGLLTTVARSLRRESK